MQKNKINLIIISGPSGSGKTTACNFLVSNYSNLVYYKNQLTTRKPRIGEGKDGAYKSIPLKEFNKLLKQKEIIIKTKFAGNYYGYKHTFLKELENANNGGKVFVIDSIQPIKNWKKFEEKYFKKMATIFLFSDIDLLRERIAKRQNIDKKNLEVRLKHAKEILKEKKLYNYKIKTNKLDKIDDKLKIIVEKIIRI